MPWVIIIGYLLGAIPTGYLAGRLLKGIDIRRVGDENTGAANVFRELGPAIGIGVGLLDAAKGAVAILIAQAVGVSQIGVLITGLATVVGHNWPVFLGFRGGRGESTAIGILLVLVTQPMLILTIPTVATLIITRNTIIASAVLFIALPVVGWLMHIPGILIIYGIALPCLVGITHYFRVRHRASPVY
jgi:glycerol-3-phosphate acyltransferase PlsY